MDGFFIYTIDVYTHILVSQNIEPELLEICCGSAETRGPFASLRMTALKDKSKGNSKDNGKTRGPFPFGPRCLLRVRMTVLLSPEECFYI
jgi:hypothetical protein